ncbi:MAG: SOS response-associated peptidase [Chitinispirillaceae bacterium]|nr:SOS response-associated peptidase [Chitinispirillaceae bacterium]
MCFRNTLSVDAVTLQNRYNARLKEPAPFAPVFHAAAFSFPAWPVITNREPALLQRFRWGLIPSWAQTREAAEKTRAGTINAKSETAFEKPSFRECMRSRRCLVPSTGFFEYRSFKSRKYPYFITLAGANVFSIAGIWDEWADRKTGEALSTFSVLTVAANPLLEKIHNEKKRMPVLLPAEKEKLWLDGALSKEEVLALCVPFDADCMKAHTVGRLISSRTEDANVPDVQKEFVYPELDAL